MSGESAEVKNEIISLAKKYGFVTPYTSYLATDEKDLITTGAPSMPRVTNLQMSADAALGRGAAVAAEVRTAG